LSVRGSRFYSGFEGHLIKSRARESRIAYNLIHDGDEGQASYEIDLPNGGLAWVIGNVIGQGEDAQNPVMVAYGSEGNAWPKNGLYVSHNSFVGTPWPPSWFLRVFADRLPADTEVKVVNNVTGPGHAEPGHERRLQRQRWALRRRAVQSIYTLDFTLTEASGWRGQAQPAGQGGGQSLQPTAAVQAAPRHHALIQPPAAWSPGAVQ
jgi:hypothetical protein